MIGHSSSDIRTADLSFVAELAHENYVGAGKRCARFGRAILDYAKRQYVVLTHSGGSALELALHALRRHRPKSRYVGVSAYVCPAVVSAIVRTGLRPLFFDIETNSLNINLECAREIIDDSVLALICTNIGGFADDLGAALELPCALVSDCAQSIGTTWEGMPLESIGDASVLSFGPTKVLTAGSGGALLLDSVPLFDFASTYSTEERPVEDYLRSGFFPTSGEHFSDLNAGLGLAQFKRLAENINRRKIIALRYTEALKRSTSAIIPTIRRESSPNYYRYYFMSDDAREWVDSLRAKGVDARSSIAHDMSEYFSGLGRLVNLKRSRHRIVSVPIYPRLQKREVEYIAELLEHGPARGVR